MELELKNGEYVPDGAGGLVRLYGLDALCERVRFRLTVRRGSFPFLPSLGSELYLLRREKAAARESAARRCVAEALTEEPGVEVTDVALRAEDGVLHLHVSLRCADGEASLTLPVTGG